MPTPINIKESYQRQLRMGHVQVLLYEIPIARRENKETRPGVPRGKNQRLEESLHNSVGAQLIYAL